MTTSGSIEIPLAAEWAQIRHERNALRERLSRLEAERGRVSEAVLERVRGDYESRRADLEARAEDLAARARHEAASLERAVDRQESEVQRLRFALEEYDLRERLGEELDPASARQAASLRSDLARLEEDLRAVAELRDRVGAIADGRSSSHSAVVAPPAAVSPPPRPAPPSPLPPPIAPPPPSAPSTESADLLPEIPPFTVPHPVGPLETLPATPLAPPARPRLVPVESPDGESAYFLSGTMVVGRNPESDLRFPVGTVSRRHAELSEGPDGWTVRDLHSENGTWVNGERTWEKVLVDGDQVQFGTVALVFRIV